MNKRILLAIILVVIAAVGLFILTRNKAPARTVGIVTYVDHAVLNKIEGAFKTNLQKLLNDPKEVTFLRGNAQGKKENLPEAVKSVLSGKPDVLVTISTPVSQTALRLVNTEQPVVFTFVTNPSDLGDELTRANCTGLSDAINYSENLRLIRRILPKAKRLAYIYNPNEANSIHGLTQVNQLAPPMGFVIVEGTVTGEKDVPMVARQVAHNSDLIYVGGDNTVVGAISAVVNIGIEAGVPVFASDSGSIGSGALAGVSVDYESLGRQTAEVVAEVLSGKKPKDIPRRVVLGDKTMINRAATNTFKVAVPKNVTEGALFIN